ncbi:hypothetical protein BU23DRAFT_575404 [Bimuria novae-zelandiae CBS 107.79]|uniref:FHA domain-containing protein n=1 Tax=Bimuria novae-zelandiae CBS 107.79 TaxID=1447943 RepID=A0A6A5UJK4_9PLEO|nr:hypothetical protein BU23DRAFT_575404 [Bimuria novae-zelandiae CBS 107.79]
MWFLEHETLFAGKRVWLRPGSQHLFGRTKPSTGDGSGGKNVFIDNKNVSRKHMTIKVLDVPPADGTKVHKRSQVEVTDFSCRQGTTVDGDKTLKSSKEADGTVTEDTTTLSGTEHTIRLSHSYPAFTLKWQDVVFTYASKEKKGASQSQASTRNEELHAMDIKTSSEFLYGKTTHVVSQKRNLPKVLQALVSGTPIVTTGYLDAILSVAAQSTDEEGNYVPSQLEEDFDRWWPQEKEYISPAGQEPVPRPDQMLAPDPSRSEVFAGLTFIFLNEAQHTSLHQVVAGGGGKALLYDIRPGETTVEEYVDYVKSVAGQKKRARGSSTSLPVVTIRLPTFPDELEQWATNFVTGVDQALNQRSVLQNEFLDAIITSDTSSLRRPPTETVSSSSIPVPERTQRSTREPTPSSPSRAPSQAPESSSVPADGPVKNEPVKTIPRKRPARRPVTSRFTGFDDYVPPTKSRKIEDTPVGDTPMEDVQAVQQSTQQSMAGHEPLTQIQAPPATQTQRNTRSQPQPAVQATHDQMFPVMAEVRKRREATKGPSVTTAASVPPDTQTQTEGGPKKTGSILERVKAKQAEREKKLKMEINVKEETRKRMAEDEDRRRDEEEKLRAALEGVDISKIHVDVQIEGMKIRPRDDRIVARTQLQGKGDGWNPEWNGRKNFKGFRRRGTDNREERAQSQRVIVTLKAAPPRKGFGDSMVMNEEVPVRTLADEMRLKRRHGGRGRLQDSDEERPIGFQKRKRAKPTEFINVEDSGPDEEIPGASGSTIRNSGRTQRVIETQLEDAQTQRDSRKRPGGPQSVAAGQPTAKKSRTARKNDDSDNEEGGFRFARRTRT